MRVLVTGGSGFLGGNVLKYLNNSGIQIIAPVRSIPANSIDSIYYPIYKDIDELANDENIFNGVTVFIHIAAAVHSHPLNDDCYDKINFKLTISLAKAAAKFNLKRFVFISSIRVNGTSNEFPFKVDDKPYPTGLYSKSKHRAEFGLKELAEHTNLEIVIIRSPLIYGKDAPGNFSILLNIAKKNIPLPLGAINNKRSFVAVDNLIDLIFTCIFHPNAKNQTFLVCDDEHISTSDFLRKLILAAGNKPRLLPVPVFLLRFIASIFGRKELVDKFTSSLTVDIEHTKQILNWKPPVSLDEGIRRCFK